MNEKTYNEILSSQRNRLFSIAFYVLRDAEDAEDVTQEAFLRLWRSTGKVDPAKVPAWLSRVVHNLCIDQTRRKKTVRRHLGQPDLFALEKLADDSQSNGGVPGNGHPSPEQENLLEAMATLTEETRSIMMMHYFQGLKLAEIAEILDLNLNSLKVRIHRARKSLRLLLTQPKVEFSAKQETG